MTVSILQLNDFKNDKENTFLIYSSRILKITNLNQVLLGY